MADKEEKKKASDLKEDEKLKESPKDGNSSSDDKEDSKVVSDSKEEKKASDSKSDETTEKVETGDASDEREESEPDEVSQYFASDHEAVTIEKRFSFMRVLFFTIVVIISALVFFAGMLYFQSSKQIPQLPQFDFMNTFAKPSPTPTPEATPTPTPEPISFEDYSVQVLNGSGVSGAAGDVASTLEDEGFVDVAASNADNQDYTETEVSMKGEVPEEVFDSLADILDGYTLTLSEALDDDSEFDIVITLGSGLSEDE